MKWSETIHFNQPLRQVSLLADAPTQDWEGVVRDREAAAYQRGRHDGESALNEQLIHQRTEISELQRGVLPRLPS